MKRQQNIVTLHMSLFPMFLLYAVILLSMVFTGIAFTHCDNAKAVPDQTEATDTDMTTNTESESELNLISLGEFRLTAYCACEKCCGKWALNRPVDENGETIVYTASMKRAEAGWTVAADTNVLPFGTRIWIDGKEYEVQDRGGAIKGNSIDIYFDTHEEACEFGLQYNEVYVVERNAT